jgi:hypothetical protein
MKKTVLLLAIFLPVLVYAAFDQTQWLYYKDISWVGGDIVKFPLDEEIFAGGRSDFSDLRVISQNGQERPYKMLTDTDANRIEYIPVQITNNSYVKGGATFAVVEIEEGKIVNRLHISTPDKNFRRNVKVYGGDDGKQWSTILDNGYIYDYTDTKGNFSSQGSTLSFSDSTFKYLKVEIDDPEGMPIKISGIEVSERVQKIAREVERTPVVSVKEDRKTNETNIVADSGQRGIPQNKAEIFATAENFNRTATVYSGNGNDQWRLLAQEYIFRYRTARVSSEKITVQFPETNDRYLKIVIQNKDDQPIGATGIKTFATYREVIFQAVSGESYKVFYGNTKVRAPEYDFEKYLQYLDIGGGSTATLSVQKNNDAYAPPIPTQKPQPEKYARFLPSMIALAGLLLLFLVYKFLKTPPKAAEDNILPKP